MIPQDIRIAGQITSTAAGLLKMIIITDLRRVTTVVGMLTSKMMEMKMLKVADLSVI
jgi:hypothetical protein